MWYPEILNEMAHYIETNPENGVTLCSALASTAQQETIAQIGNSTQVNSISETKHLSNHQPNFTKSINFDFTDIH